MPKAVELYVYDLTNGLAKQISPMMLGIQVDAIFHTAIVIAGTEYFFGQGIQKANAGTTPFGQPMKKITLGTADVTGKMIEEVLLDLGARFKPSDYNLLFHNCNHFSNEFSQLLTGTEIPMEGITGSATATGFGGAGARS
eukprot:gene29283-12526_t